MRGSSQGERHPGRALRSGLACRPAGAQARVQERKEVTLCTGQRCRPHASRAEIDARNRRLRVERTAVRGMFTRHVHDPSDSPSTRRSCIRGDGGRSVVYVGAYESAANRAECGCVALSTEAIRDDRIAPR